jgi:formate dehydrogenase beta subunit
MDGKTPIGDDGRMLDRMKTPDIGRKLARTRPKGRPLDEQALAEVLALVGKDALRRDLLIEHLHVIQDRYGHLAARHLRALAELHRIGQAEVFEVASFYHHFDIVKENETPPAALTIRVCDSLSCAMAGGEQLADALATLTDPAHIRVQRVACVGRCAAAPVAIIGQNPMERATPESVLAAAAAGESTCVVAAGIALDAYRSAGGYGLLKRIRSGALTVDMMIATLSDAGLRGLGGAGFPVGRKWQSVRGFPGPRLMTVNGDEGEPGTFKDRYYLERDPHRFMEGMLIAAHAVEAERVYLYIRDEYPGVIALLRREIAALEAVGLINTGYIELRRGAGAYICGEESAMIESIEGKRGLPRQRPPYIAEVGLFGRATLNHNIETLVWLCDILEKGPDWFASQGVNGAKGLRSWSVSGRVRNPGVIIAPAGITARELIVRAGGMAEGHTLKAYLPGGASGGILPASHGDLPLDFGSLADHGCFVGSHAVVVLSDKDDMAEVARNLMRFFKHESCGQCTPCRAGTEKALALMQAPRWDAALLKELSAVMMDASICGLGQAAPNPVLSVLKHFPEEAGA